MSDESNGYHEETRQFMINEHRAEDAAEQAMAHVGIDLYLVADGLFKLALYMVGNNVDNLDNGLFLTFEDEDDRTWTFSVIPPDGGKVQDQLLQGLGLQEDDQ
jgi:hypothetical protein